MRERRPRRLRVVVLDLRRRRALPDARGRRAAADLALRDHQARRRAPRAAHMRGASGSTSSSCATSTPSARDSARTWPSRAWLFALAEGRPFDLYGDGAQTRGWTYVADVVAATMLAMDRRRRGRTTSAAASEASMREAIAIARARLRTAARAARGTAGARRPAPHRAPTRPGSASELGWQPRVSLEDGLSAQWEWASARVGRPMSADPDSASATRELDAEQEIDLGRIWRAIDRALVAARSLGLVAGAIIGLLVSLGGGKTWKATAEVYLGQPLVAERQRRSRAPRPVSGSRPPTSTSSTRSSMPRRRPAFQPGQLRGEVTVEADPRPHRHEDRPAGAADAALGDRREGRRGRGGRRRRSRALVVTAVPALLGHRRSRSPGPL